MTQNPHSQDGSSDSPRVCGFCAGIRPGEEAEPGEVKRCPGCGQYAQAWYDRQSIKTPYLQTTNGECCNGVHWHGLNIWCSEERGHDGPCRGTFEWNSDTVLDDIRPPEGVHCTGCPNGDVEGRLPLWLSGRLTTWLAGRSLRKARQV